MAHTTGLNFRRTLTEPRTKAYDLVRWVKRGGAELPEAWSEDAIDTARQYLIGGSGANKREVSLRQATDRVVDTIVRHGIDEGYLTKAVAEDFREELKALLVTQRAAFDSPIWLNVGVSDRPRYTSSYFLLRVTDMADITEFMQNWYNPQRTTLYGDPSIGVNSSFVPSVIEAGLLHMPSVVGSQATMFTLDAGHPDIGAFIQWKGQQAPRLDLGDDEAKPNIRPSGQKWSIGNIGKKQEQSNDQYGNASTTVLVPDDFMNAVVSGREWELHTMREGRTLRTIKARELFRLITQAAWETGSPGLLFGTTSNKWHTTPNAGRIYACSPDAGYTYLDETGCTMASINLLPYLNSDHSFDIEGFKHAVELLIVAQELLVGYSQYPTEAISKNTRVYRPIGIGYSNLGAFLAAQGLAYDSDESRSQAAAITALLTGHAYAVSARIAKQVGPFGGYHKDRDNILRVLKMHRAAISAVNVSLVSEDLLSAATVAWDEAVELGELYGIRNAQVSLIASTVLANRMMGSASIGIDPALVLVANRSGQPADQSEKVISPYLARLKMMAAVQPFLSGAVAMTIRVPENITTDEAEQLYLQAWSMGLKAVAICRDDQQHDQQTDQPGDRDSRNNYGTVQEQAMPDERFGKRTNEEIAADMSPLNSNAGRRELPRICNARTYRFDLAGVSGRFTVNEFADGTPGELLITLAKQDATLAGLVDAFAATLSCGLQYGVPLKSYIMMLQGASFSPNGPTDDPDVPTASSITDYIMRRLALDYLSSDDGAESI